MSGDLTRAFLEEVVRGSGWSLAEVESLSLEGEGIRSLHGSLGGLRRLVYLNLARNKLSALLGIEHLVSLGTLVLRENRVESMDEVGRLSCLGDLRDLDLRLNPVMATASRRHSGGRSNGSGSDRPRADVVAALPQLVTLDGRGVREDESPHRPRRPQQQQQQQHTRWPDQSQRYCEQHHQHHQQRMSAPFPARPATATAAPPSRMGESEGLSTVALQEEGRLRTKAALSGRRFGKNNNSSNTYQGCPPETGTARPSRHDGNDVDEDAGSGRLGLPATAKAAQISCAAPRREGRVATPAAASPVIPTQTPKIYGNSSIRRDNGLRHSVGGGSGAAELGGSGSGAPRRGRQREDSRELHVVEIADGGGGSADCRRENGRALVEHRTEVAVDWARRKRDRPGAQDVGKGSSSSRSNLYGEGLAAFHLEHGLDVVCGGGGGGGGDEDAVVVEDLGGTPRVPPADGSRLGRGACAVDERHRHPRRQEPPHVAGMAAPWTPVAATAAGQPRSRGGGGGGSGGGGDDDLAALWRELGTTRESLDSGGKTLVPSSPPRPAFSSSSARDSRATATTTTTSSKTSATAASGSSAARAVEAFRRSSQRLGLLSAVACSSAAAAADGGHRSLAAGVGDADGTAEDAAPRSSLPLTTAADGGRRSLAAGVGDGDCAAQDAAPRPSLPPTTTTTPARAAHGLSCCPGGIGRSAGCGDGYSGRAGGGRGGGCSDPIRPTDTKCGDDVTPAARSFSPVAPSTGPPVCARVVRGEAEESVIMATGGRELSEDEVPAAAAAADAGAMWFPAHGDMAERWWAREREFEARWCAREREFDARWAAREREFDLRLHESSKFTAEMRSMLLGAHEALISSNGRLVETLKAAEAAAAAAAAAKVASAGSSTSAPAGGAAADRIWSCDNSSRSSTSNAQVLPATSAASSSTADPRSSNTARLLLGPAPPPRNGADGGAVSEHSGHVAAPATGAAGAGDPGGDAKPCSIGSAAVWRAASVPVPPPPLPIPIPPPTYDNGGGRSLAGGAGGVSAPAVAVAASRRRSFTADVPAASGYKSTAAPASGMDQVPPSPGGDVVESTGEVAPGTRGGREAIVSADSLRRVSSGPPSCLVSQRVDEGGSVARGEVAPSPCTYEGPGRRILAGGGGGGSASLPSIVAVSTVERSQEAHGRFARREACVVSPAREATQTSNFDESSKRDGGVVVAAAGSALLAVACDGGEVFGRDPEFTVSVSPSHNIKPE